MAIRPCHLLLAFIHTPEGVGKLVLASLVGDVAELEPKIQRYLPRRLRVRLPKDAVLPASAALKRVFDAAKQSSTRLGHDWIGTEHLLLGLAQSPDRIVERVFRHSGITREMLEKATCDYLDSIGFNPATESE
jgi:ATP-dependent Clp protease ATP-binding subunit ClpA